MNPAAHEMLDLDGETSDWILGTAAATALISVLPPPPSGRSSEMERALRTTTVSPTGSPTTTMPPSLAPTSSRDSDDTKGGGGLRWLGGSVGIFLAAIVLWRLWVRYQQQVEQRMLDYRSKQADRVLGDMQMVPNEDLDNELL